MCHSVQSSFCPFSFSVRWIYFCQSVTLITGRDRRDAKMTQLNICPNMSVRFRRSRPAHYGEMCNCPWPQIETHKHTHTQTSVHNNNTMINSTMCSVRAVLMLSGQSINPLMGMWLAALVTLCGCSVIRVKCSSERVKDHSVSTVDMQLLTDVCIFSVCLFMLKW